MTGATYWSKPPHSSTPHSHVGDWQDTYGFPISFSSHEDVAFPTRTTQELLDENPTKVGEAYRSPLGMPVTELNETGQFAQVVPEFSTIVGLLGLGGCLLSSSLLRRKHQK